MGTPRQVYNTNELLYFLQSVRLPSNMLLNNNVLFFVALHPVHDFVTSSLTQYGDGQTC